MVVKNEQGVDLSSLSEKFAYPSCTIIILIIVNYKRLECVVAILLLQKCRSISLSIRMFLNSDLTNMILV